MKHKMWVRMFCALIFEFGEVGRESLANWDGIGIFQQNNNWMCKLNKVRENSQVAT